jgi:hypothetical protein
LKKVKDWFLLKLFKIQYAEEETRRTVRLGSKIGILAVVVIGATMLLIKTSPMVFTNETYNSVKEPVSELFKITEKANLGDKFTFVLYRDDCQSCLNVEKSLVREVSAIKQSYRNGRYIFLDLNEFDNKEKNKLINLFPEILVAGDKIPTPLVANVEKTSKDWKITSQSNTDEKKKIEAVLLKSKE